MSKNISAIKNFVNRHEVAVTAIATALPLIWLHLSYNKVVNQFLNEKNLSDEFYNHF